MTAIPLSLRGFWALVALAQLVVAIGAPLADAVHEGGAVELVTHVESQTGEHCPSQHDHLFCQLCRTVLLGWADVPPARLQAPRIRTAGSAALRAEAHSPRPSGHFPPLGSRAPPLG